LISLKIQDHSAPVDIARSLHEQAPDDCLAHVPARWRIFAGRNISYVIFRKSIYNHGLESFRYLANRRDGENVL